MRFTRSGNTTNTPNQTGTIRTSLGNKTSTQQTWIQAVLPIRSLPFRSLSFRSLASATIVSTTATIGALAFGGLCLNSFSSTVAAPTAAMKTTVTNPLQENEVQDDDDQDAPPPRRGRKKFQDAPKRGRVVPDVPNAPAAPGGFGQMFGGPMFGGPMFGGPAFPGQMQMANAGGNQSVSRSNINGNVTTVVQNGDRKIQVEEGRQGVFISLIRNYHRSDLPELEKSNPKLAEALKAFPDDMNGEMLDVTVTSTKKYEAASVEALEKDHPEGYKLYQEAMKAADANGGMNFGNAQGMNPGFSPFTDAQLQQMQQMEQEMQKAQQRMQQQFQQNGFGFQFGN